MTIGRIALLAAIAVGVMAANVAATFLYMVVYSYVIDPGHDKAYYEAHAQVAAPYCSLVAGMPLMFFTAMWVGSWDVRLAVQSALIIWLAYVVIDLAILLGVGMTRRIAVVFAVAGVTKLVAAWAGALLAARGA